MVFRDSIDAMAKQVQRDRDDSDSRNAARDADKRNGTPTKLSTEVLESLSNLPSPEEIQESMSSSIWNLVFPRIYVSRSPKWDHLEDCSLFGSGFEKVGENNIPYVIGYDKRASVYIWLKVGTTTENELQAYIHALLLSRLLSDKNNNLESKRIFRSNLLRR